MVLKKYWGFSTTKIGAIVALAMLLTFLLSGCADNALQTRVQTLAKENADLQTRVQILTNEKAALQAALNQSDLKIDYLDTTASVTLVNGEIDWHKYVAQHTFTAGSKDGLWLMFGFSNILHSGKINIVADIYIISGGELVDRKSNDATLTNSTFNNLYWGDSFDMSAYPPGDYDVLVTIRDIIGEAVTTKKTSFKIVSVPETLPNGK